MHFLYKNTLIEIVSLRRVGQELVPEVMCIEVAFLCYRLFLSSLCTWGLIVKCCLVVNASWKFCFDIECCNGSSRDQETAPLLRKCYDQRFPLLLRFNDLHRCVSWLLRCCFLLLSYRKGKALTACTGVVIALLIVACCDQCNSQT